MDQSTAGLVSQGWTVCLEAQDVARVIGRQVPKGSEFRATYLHGRESALVVTTNVVVLGKTEHASLLAATVEFSTRYRLNVPPHAFRN